MSVDELWICDSRETRWTSERRSQAPFDAQLPLPIPHAAREPAVISRPHSETLESPSPPPLSTLALGFALAAAPLPTLALTLAGLLWRHLWLWHLPEQLKKGLEEREGLGRRCLTSTAVTIPRAAAVVISVLHHALQDARQPPAKLEQHRHHGRTHLQPQPAVQGQASLGRAPVLLHSPAAEEQQREGRRRRAVAHIDLCGAYALVVGNVARPPLAAVQLAVDGRRVNGRDLRLGFRV